MVSLLELDSLTEASNWLMLTETKENFHKITAARNIAD